jgi:hypothetical protein
MIDIEKWMKEALEKLKECFSKRLLFVGLQGSYARDEAVEESDIDVVVVLNELSVPDLLLYRKIIQSMPYPEKACGFVSGREEIANWPKSDLLQFEMETIPWHGSLAGILPPLYDCDIRDGIRIGAANLYHAACHTYMHVVEAERIEALNGFYKAVFFVLQSLHRLETGHYVKKKSELLPKLDGTRQKILLACMERDSFALSNADEFFGLLISWCGEVLKTV